MSQSPNVILCFGLERLWEIILAWIDTTCHLEILPNEQAEFWRRLRLKLEKINIEHTVARIVENVLFINATTPHADHVLIAISEQLEPRAVSLWGHRGEEGVPWYPVRP